MADSLLASSHQRQLPLITSLPHSWMAAKLRSAFARAASAAGLVGAAVLAFSGDCAAQSCSATIPTGAYGPVDILSGASSDTTASFSVTCSGTLNRTLRLCLDVSRGTTVNNAGVTRALASGANYLLHDIYSDPGRQLEWGAWGGGTFLFPFGSGGIQRDLALGATGSATLNLILYGRINASQQTVPPGTYTWKTASAGFTYFYAGTTTPSCPSGTLFYRGNPDSSVWTATILPNCLVTATNVNFGTTGVLAANIDAVGTIQARCTNTTPYSIALSNGIGGGTGPLQRKMVKSTESVIYGLYQDAGHTLPFGSSLGSDTVSGTGTGLAQTINVYGRILPQATPSAGDYADTITVTLTY